jgi:hypothetical protein
MAYPFLKSAVNKRFMQQLSTERGRLPLFG